MDCKTLRSNFFTVNDTFHDATKYIISNNQRELIKIIQKIKIHLKSELESDICLMKFFDKHKINDDEIYKLYQIYRTITLLNIYL